MKSLLQKIKHRAFSWFKRDLEASLTLAEREKFQILCERDRQTPVPLINFAGPREVTAQTYRQLHGQHGYACNNWAFGLKSEPEMLSGNGYFEFGAGNGFFVEFLQKNGKCAAGVDLINPRQLPNVITGDFQDAFSSAQWKETDVVYSADFLEHLDSDELKGLLKKWAEYDKKHVHMIACYDDNVSHKTVMEPHAWALLFSRYFSSVDIRKVCYRRYPNKKLAVLLVCHR